MTMLLRTWGVYSRATARWPLLATLAPFVPLVCLWIALTESGIFPRAFLPGTRWFLAVRADLPRADLIDRVQRLTKSCASAYVLELVNRAWNGLPTIHIPVPPSAIAPKVDLTYFEFTMTGGCATSLTKTQELGVYVPQGIPGAYLEVAVLLPE